MIGLGPLYNEEETRASEFAHPPPPPSLHHVKSQKKAATHTGQEEGPHQICQ